MRGHVCYKHRVIIAVYMAIPCYTLNLMAPGASTGRVCASDVCTAPQYIGPADRPWIYLIMG